MHKIELALAKQSESFVGADPDQQTRRADADNRFGQPRPRQNLVGVIVVAIVALATMILDVRPFTDVGERRIGHADQAGVAMVARNIAEGHGAVTDAVWLIHGGGPPGPQIRHPEGYWSIYVAGVVSPFFKVFAANLQFLLLVGSLFKTAIAFLGFWWVLYQTERVHIATACGVILLLEPTLVNGVRGLSDIYLAFFVFVSVTSLIWAFYRQSKLWWLICGASVAVAIGMKPSGIILLGLISILFVVAPRRRPVILASWPFLISLTLFLTPLAMHNYRSAGTVFWPDAAVMRSASLQMDAARPFGPYSWNNKETVHAWNAAAYDPESQVGIVSSFSPQGVKTHLKNFAGFGYAWLKFDVVPLWILPFAFVGAVGWTRARMKGSFTCQTPYEMFIAATLILTLGSCFLGAAVHFEPRYYLFLVPMYVVVGVIEAARLSKWLVLGQLLIVVVMGIAIYLSNDRALDTRKIAEYHIADDVLPADAAVMTQNPWEFAFHTRRPSVVLPYNGEYRVLREVAERFKLTHLVVIGQEVRHPELEPLNRGEFPPFIEKVHEADDIVIGRFLLGAKGVHVLSSTAEPPPSEEP